MKNVLITGTSRGIGLEFVRQFLDHGDIVLATCRYPKQADELQKLLTHYEDRLIITRIDVTDESTIDASYQEIVKRIERLDLLINNAGVYDEGQSLGSLKLNDGIHSFSVNAIGPILVAQKYLGLLKKGGQSKVVSISSGMGAFTNKRDGGHYFYCASKAALNMNMLAYAYDAKQYGITSIVLSPGWVKTDMGGPNAPLTPTESVSRLIKIIDRITLKDTGKFFNWDGNEHKW